MKAIIWTKYGSPDGLFLRDIPKPIPGENEICIKVYATSVIKGDCEMRSLDLPLALRLPIRLFNGFSAPKRIQLLGQEFSGIVDSAGSGVNSYKNGDEIFGATGFGHGTYAEYICLPVDSKDDLFITKPDKLTFEEAAVVPVGALEALHFLSRSSIQPGETILINGAGGSIGTMAVQIAKMHGTHITAVDSSDKLEMLKSIGADIVLDYQKVDFSKQDKKYDIIFDVAGKAHYRRCISSLNPGGRFLISNPTLTKLLHSIVTKITTDKKVVITAGDRNENDIITIKELIDTGKLQPVIDQRYTLDKMADAHRYVDTGNKKGNVVVTIHN